MSAKDTNFDTARLQHLCRPDGPFASAALPGVSLYRRDAPSTLESELYEPVLCLVLSGQKTVRSGTIEAIASPGEALVVSHHLPVVSHITQATPQVPYLAIVLSLDRTMLRALIAQIGDLAAPQDINQAMACKPCDPSWVDPLVRYIELVNEPQALAVLGPSLLREIHYRVLTSSNGAILRNIVFQDSHANGIARAISRIRAEMATPLRVATLAQDVGMSPSSFHSHFKAVTGTTPLQYQKDLRLISARALLDKDAQSVAATAFEVGYESPTHFSRDFKRKFGRNPSAKAA